VHPAGLPFIAGGLGMAVAGRRYRWLRRAGLLTAGEGPPLLLVHGGMGCTLAVLDGQGHEAIESAPGLLASQLADFFGY